MSPPIAWEINQYSSTTYPVEHVLMHNDIVLDMITGIHVLRNQLAAMAIIIQIFGGYWLEASFNRNLSVPWRTVRIVCSYTKRVALFGLSELIIHPLMISSWLFIFIAKSC